MLTCCPRAVLEVSHWGKGQVRCPSPAYWGVVLAVVPPAVLIVAATGRTLVSSHA